MFGEQQICHELLPEMGGLHVCLFVVFQMKRDDFPVWFSVNFQGMEVRRALLVECES